jgi:hypothetical protein
MQLLAEKVEEKLLLKSNLASPTFTGTPLAPTAVVDTSTTQLATTAFVINQGYIKSADAFSTYAPLSSPAFIGNPTAITQSIGDSSTKLATTEFINNALSNFVTLPSQTGADGKFLSSDGINAAWNTITIQDVLSLQDTFTNLAGVYFPINITISSQTSNYSIQSSDSSRQIEMNLSVPNTVTVTKDLPLPNGARITIVQTGVGQTTIVAENDVVINATPGLKLKDQWSVATLIKRSTNTWLVYGDISA